MAQEMTEGDRGTVPRHIVNMQKLKTEHGKMKTKETIKIAGDRRRKPCNNLQMI